jgi:antitoxin (DNA-binding transcriptional repressor) of toxin-antitoxin stability system
MAVLSISEARAILPELLDRVAEGEEITITRHGSAVAVMLRPDAVRTRRAGAVVDQAREIAAMLAAARDQPLSSAEVTAGRAEELVAEIATGRDRS